MQINKRISSYECTERLRFWVLANISHKVPLRTILKKLTKNLYSVSSFILYIYYTKNFYFLQIKPVTGIGPVFEPWQGPALTTILHRQKLEYMRNLSRHIFSTMPGRTHFNYHVQLAACLPNRWVGSYVQQHLTPITPLSKENRRPSFWSFHFSYSDNYLYLIIFSLILIS